MPNCLIIDGHPFTPSFSGAAADRYAKEMESAGVTVHRLNLHEMTVPDLTRRKPAADEMTGDIARFWEEMVWADHVMIVHPLWWGGMPAKLKALFDIGLQPGRAYTYQPKSALPLGLLKGRSARLVVTSDTPGWFMALAYGNAHFKAAKNQILKFVGLSPVRLSHLFEMRTTTPEKRAALLDRVARDARADIRRLAGAPRSKLPGRLAA